MRFVVLRSEGPVELELPDEETTVLQGLLDAQDQVPDLAFRWGCRNERCGTCTVEVNGRRRLGCRDPLRDGDVVGPLSGLPVVKDLVVDRRAVSRQLPRVPVRPASGPAAGAWASLGRCIDCLACVADCPLHLADRGSPVTFLKLQRAALEGAEEAVPVAVELGLLDACAGCRGCRCSVGIRLVAEVIDPLLEAAGGAHPG